MIELFVENSIVDINVGFSTLLTYAIDDIKDFGAKNTTFSKTIILPGTKRNNILFGNIFEITGSNNYTSALPNKGINFNAAISAKAYIFADNIQCFKGIFRILQVVIDDGIVEYECSVVGELGGFVSKMGNLKLEDLDFSAYNHTYSIANIIASRSALGSGYIYPNNIDYGTYSTNKKHWQYGTMRPALFVKEYVNKIFAASGYTYDCTLFGTARFEGLIVPHNRKDLVKKSNLQLDISSTVGQTMQLDSLLTPKGFSFAIQPTLGYFVPSTGFYLKPNSKFTYTFATSTKGDLDLNYDIDYDNSASALDVIVTLKKNGVSIAGFSQIYINAGDIDNFSTEQFFYGVTFANTDYLTFEAEFVGTPSLSDICNFTINSCRIIFQNTGNSYALITLGQDVIINDTIPQNILQKDFISSIVKLFNLYIFEDANSLDKVLKIMPFVDFYSDAETIDWSDKIDRSKPLKVKPMSQLNARYYEFKFKKDADYYNDLYSKRYNEDYGTYKYDSQFEFANETNKVELIFSGTPLLGYSGEDKVYSAIFKRTGDVTGAGEEKIDSNIRILQTKLITGVASWNILNGATVLGSYTNYLYAGHLNDPDAPADDIQFGVPKELFFTLATGALNVNQFNVYWSSYMAEITDKDSKMLTCNARLKYKDIYNLDFSKLIWVDGSLFRLNKIIDFNATAEDECTIELIKIINRIY
jgi:hypothetical protein